MPGIQSCPECKVPRHISDEHLWLDNGVIVSKRDEKARMSFFESENLDPLYEGIGRLIGMPIERLVIDVSRRRTREYIDHLVPDEILELFRSRQIELRPMIDIMLDTSVVMGYAKMKIVDIFYEESEKDYVSITIAEPYSLPLACGSFEGTVEALVGGESGMSYVEIQPNVYQATVFRAESPPELSKRLRWKGYDKEFKEGDIEIKRCPTCGVPAALAGFKWFYDRGVIKSKWTHRRMAMLGPAMLDPVFEELEEEVGKAIPQVVVEAQRQFVRTGFYSIEEIGDEGNIRSQFALRGLGNVREIRMGKKGVIMRVENAAMHLLVAGLIQGLFEMTFGIDSNVEWELSEEGHLEVEVSPRNIVETVSV
jgi:hypothetical protein